VAGKGIAPLLAWSSSLIQLMHLRAVIPQQMPKLMSEAEALTLWYVTGTDGDQRSRTLGVGGGESLSGFRQLQYRRVYASELLDQFIHISDGRTAELKSISDTVSQLSRLLLSRQLSVRYRQEAVWLSALRCGGP
jgi:hypothetical protein